MQLLLDAGFKILGSADSPAELEGIVRLRIQGSGLPERCEYGEPLIVLTVVQEAYGSQKICRLADIKVLDARSIPADLSWCGENGRELVNLPRCATRSAT